MKKIFSSLLTICILVTCIAVHPVSASAAAYISVGEAKSIAFKNAGVKSSKVTVTKAKLDYDDGIRIYDVEFYTNIADYEYEINAKTGKIVDKDIDKEFTINLSTNTYTYNGKAKNPTVTITKKNGTKISAVNYTVSYKDNVNPGEATVYIKFNDKSYTGKFSKTYKIKPKTQKITSVKRSDTTLTIKWNKDSTVSGYQIQYSTNNNFSNAKTKTIESKNTVSTTIKSVKKQKYYARIRAYKNSGSSRIYGSWSAKGVATSDYIGTAKAKSIALNHAGLKESQVSALYAKLDTEDGIKVYEVEWRYNGYEYDYVINATSGKIIEHEKEK